MTHVETTPATTQDRQTLEPIHRALIAQDLLPAEHLVDAGYVDAPRLVANTRAHQVRLIGPAPADVSWHASAGQGFAPACCAIDWVAQHVTCPAGQQSSRWRPGVSASGQEVIHVRFARDLCRMCATGAMHEGQIRWAGCDPAAAGAASGLNGTTGVSDERRIQSQL